MKRPKLLARLLMATLAGLPFAVPAQSSAVERDEHRRIVAERAAAEERYVAQERACRERFIVSSCIEDAKRTRRALLGPLRERQIALDTAQRARSAAERKESIAKKASDDAQRGGVAMTSRAGRKAASGASSPAVGAATGASAPSGRVAKTPSPSKRVAPQSLEARVGDEQGNRDAFAARQQEAAIHREEVAARNAEREKKRKPAKPLPETPAVSGAASPSMSSPAASAAR